MVIKKMDTKFKWLVGGLAVFVFVSVVLLKSPVGEKLGINLKGVDSDASYSKDQDFKGRPAPVICDESPCLDSRVQVTSPVSDSRILPRKTHKIGWTEDESVESRFHEISIHAIDCDSNCPEPYVIATNYRGVSPYKWQIGSFLPVPENLRNVPVWLRVSTQGRFDANGQPADVYNQIPVVISQYR